VESAFVNSMSSVLMTCSRPLASMASKIASLLSKYWMSL
jgi:hypothetical protein